MAKTILFESKIPGPKYLGMCPPMRGSTVLSTSTRAMSEPSACSDMGTSSRPALRRSVKGSEWRPKSRHKIVSFDRGRPKPSYRWHGLRASVVVKEGNTFIMAKGCRRFCRKVRRLADAGC